MEIPIFLMTCGGNLFVCDLFGDSGGVITSFFGGSFGGIGRIDGNLSGFGTSIGSGDSSLFGLSFNIGAFIGIYLNINYLNQLFKKFK